VSLVKDKEDFIQDHRRKYGRSRHDCSQLLQWKRETGLDSEDL
jgi:hypothetical protein